MKKLISYSGDERRATITGINLFFSALLGANLGTLGDIPLDEYVHITIMLVGAVTALLTIAVTRRKSTVIGSAFALAVLLPVLAVIPGRKLAELAHDLQRISITLGIWLVMLLFVRFTPSVETDEHAADEPADDDELELPKSRGS